MEIETTISKIGDSSYYVRIPAIMAKYFKLEDNKSKAIIQDISESEAKIIF